MEEELFLPTLMHWQYQNKWYGSLRRASFLVTPSQDTLSAEVWTGPAIHDQAEIQQTAQFPLSEEGLQQLHAWLSQQADAINQANPGPFVYQW